MGLEKQPLSQWNCLHDARHSCSQNCHEVHELLAAALPGAWPTPASLMPLTTPPLLLLLLLAGAKRSRPAQALQPRVASLAQAPCAPSARQLQAQTCSSLRCWHRSSWWMTAAARGRQQLERVWAAAAAGLLRAPCGLRSSGPPVQQQRQRQLLPAVPSGHNAAP